MFEARYFESKDRYYKIVIMNDLLNDLVLFTCWGGKSNRLGGHKTFLIKNLDEGLILSEKIIAQRIKRGYFEIFKNTLEGLSAKTQVQIKEKQPTQRKREKPSIVKKSDALDPKKYIKMLSRIQHAIPQAFTAENVSSQNLNQEISNRFPEYSPQEIEALWKQWKATPFFVGLRSETLP